MEDGGLRVENGGWRLRMENGGCAGLVGWWMVGDGIEGVGWGVRALGWLTGIWCFGVVEMVRG